MVTGDLLYLIGDVDSLVYYQSNLKPKLIPPKTKPKHIIKNISTYEGLEKDCFSPFPAAIATLLGPVGYVWPLVAGASALCVRCAIIDYGQGY